MALDMLRAIGREPDALHALLDDLAGALADDARLRPQVAALADALGKPAETMEAQARRHAQQLVLLVQARLLREHAPQEMADAFIASRFDAQWGRVFGMLPEGAPHEAILARAWPV